MDFLVVIHTRRSIRRFLPAPVPEEAIRKMVDAALRAPNESNPQPWIWLVVRDQAKRDALQITASGTTTCGQASSTSPVSGYERS